MPNETLIVTFGLCLSNGTWRTEKTEVEIFHDPYLPEPETGRSLGDIAFDQWCIDQLPENSSKEDKENAVQFINEPFSGYFVLEWQIKDSKDSTERPDRECDKDCARRLAGDDSVECTCSRSRQAAEEATVFKVDDKIVKVGNDVRVEVPLFDDNESIIIVLTHEGLIFDYWRDDKVIATQSITYEEKAEELLG